MRIWHVLLIAIVLAVIWAARVSGQVHAAEDPTAPPKLEPIILDGVRYELEALGTTVDRNAETKKLEFCWIVTVVVQAHQQRKTIKFGFLSGDDSIPPDRIIWESSFRDGIFYRNARCNDQLLMMALKKLVAPSDERPERLEFPDYVVKLL